jgi:NADPH-dependent curcumin reductase CurA
MRALTEVAPDGIDVYYDNVGGSITDAVMQLIRLRARVVICGQISQYQHLDDIQSGPRFLHRLIYTRACITGVLARDYTDRQHEMEQQMSEWLHGGKLRYQETIHHGFKSLPSSLNSLFHGANTGKLLVKVADNNDDDDRAAVAQAAATLKMNNTAAESKQ